MRRISCICMIILMLASAAMFSSCGNSTGADATQEEITEETVQAADPMTEEEQEADDSEGCIEDSEDLLY